MLHSIRIATALLLGSALAGVPALAQSGPVAFSSSAPSEGGAVTALDQGRYAVVIDLDRNRLYFQKGELTLWSAPVGTGTGLRLETDEDKWDFSTPNGVFHVKYKALNPTWIAPDWYFIENGLPVPSPNDPKRFFPGGLGTAAVYIEHDLAIHGTDKPELLGQRVSHGCIRLANKDALRLFHNVQVGTEVIIVGGERVQARVTAPKPRQRSTFTPGNQKPPPPDPVVEGWKALETGELLAVLETELWLDDESSRWPEVAGLLLQRGLEDEDDEALEGLFAGAVELPSTRLEREYATFLADAFGRGAFRTLAAMSRLKRQQRAKAAEAIVAATLELYSGSLRDSGAPWPTSKVGRDMVEPEGRRGWDALAEAERAFRARGDSEQWSI